MYKRTIFSRAGNEARDDLVFSIVSLDAGVARQHANDVAFTIAPEVRGGPLNDSPVRLTSLAHGGGCGCKLAPSVLQELVGSAPALRSYPQLLVGTETGDDAAVWRLDDDACIIATTDFFMPMVHAPYDFRRIP